MQEPIFYCSKSRWAAHFRSQDTRLQTSTCTETQKDPHYRTLLYMATFTLWRHRPFQNITMCTNVTSQCVQKSFCERWCNILSIEASYLEKLFSPTELYPVIKNMHLTRPLKTLHHFHFHSRNRHPRHDWWLNVAEVYGVTAAPMSSISTTSVFSQYWCLSHHTQFQAKNKTNECDFPLYLIHLSRPFHFILDGDALVQQLSLWTQ